MINVTESTGYVTTFRMNDGTDKKLRVLGSRYHKYDAMTIQISKVIDENNPEIRKDGIFYQFKYVYEEIDNKTDFVQYTHYMSPENLKKNYPWCRDLFK